MKLTTSAFRAILVILAAAVPALDGARAADVPVLEDFLSGLRVRDVAMSPDARYLSMIGVQDGRA